MFNNNENSTGLPPLAIVGLIALAVALFIFNTKRKKRTVPVGAKPYTPNDEIITSVTFDDVAGNEEAKSSMQDLIAFMQDPERFQKYGAKMPRGVILYGPPGTGKTLMARALAGEARVHFFALSGSDFVEMYAGVGAMRVRELFTKAKKHGKCVIFIDEIDAIGKKRRKNVEESNDERDQTLNALLSEMSGFTGGEGTLVVAATNRLDTLDDALLRPGRFDRHIEVGLPDLFARKKILAYHLLGKPFDDSLDIEALAKMCVMFSGAKLQTLVNEAAIIAAKRDDGSITQADLEEAYYILLAGKEKVERDSIDNTDRRITAVHEAGHAITIKLLQPENVISKVSIIPSGNGAGGYNLSIPPDKNYITKENMLNQICVYLAGRAAEEHEFGGENITTGAENDLLRASQCAMDYMYRFAMGNSLLHGEVLQKIGFTGMKDELESLLKEQYERARSVISGNSNALYALSDALLSNETMREEELDELLTPYLSKNYNDLQVDNKRGIV